MFTANFNNLILNTDSYKASHYLQYPPQTEYLSYYIEARKENQAVVFFGLQAFLLEYLQKPISLQDIDEAQQLLQAHGLPFNRAGWLRIIEKYQGYLPLKIEAVPEGRVIPSRNVLCQISNTDPEFYWLPGYIETALLRAVYYPSTVASNSYRCKQLLKAALEKSADNLQGLPFKLHDFGARGATSLESVALGGLAHLVNFQGTDSVSALVAANRWYAAQEVAGFSIPAAEHSTITAWGKSQEAQAYNNMLQQFAEKYPVFAVVSDSYDLWHAVGEIWGNELKAKVENLQGTLVIRPDSGDPVEIVCKTLQLLEAKFGCSINSKGYKVLPPYVRIIQGDGINLHSLNAILEAIMDLGFSVDNVNFGMGAGLLQQLDRDTLGWTMKASAICINGQWQDIFKAPITGQNKRSKKGRLALIYKNGEYQTINRQDLTASDENLLQTVFLNGKILQRTNLTEVRQRSNETHHEYSK